MPWNAEVSAGSETLTTVLSMNARLDPRIVDTSVHRCADAGRVTMRSIVLCEMNPDEKNRKKQISEVSQL